MTVRTLPMLATSCLVILAACASAGRDSSRRPLAGCYQFEWTTDARELRLPWGFELTADSLEGWPNVPEGRHAVTRVTEARTMDHPIAFWMPVAGDSIRVGHPGGGGFAFTLGRDGRDLSGWARAVGDAVRPGETMPRPPHPVTARRVLCPAPTGG